jgi:alkylated DNA repair dioxygenase AlkB
MQVSLFAPVSRLQRLDMEKAEVHFMEGFYNPEQAKRYFAQLRSATEWRHETLRLWGKSVEQPRLTAWYGDAGRTYSYSGLQLQAHPWTPLLLAIKQDIEALTGDDFNSVLLNLYRDGQDSVAWHSDDEAELGPRPVIASLSLGATRTFKFRHKQNGHMVSIVLHDGCLLRMAGDTQHCWKHAVLKEKPPTGPRINLTFRHIRC